MNRRTPMISFVGRFLADRRGSAAVEYGLIAALIATVVVAAVSAVGASLSSQFVTISSHLNPAA